MNRVTQVIGSICFVAAGFVLPQGTSAGEICMPHEVKIENASSRHILVTSVRWLETEEEKWLDQPFEKLVIAPGDSWNG